MANKKNKIKFVVSPKIDVKEKKYCRFTKNNIKYVDYKDVDFLKDFVDQHGKLLPRRVTGNSQKWQRRVAQAVKRARHLGLMPYITDHFKN